MTIKKIASDLNLSIAAVSAALGSQSTSKVSALTADRVREYARKVNYRPSLIGRSMRSRRLHQVAALVESDFGQRRMVPTIETSALFGLNDYLQSREWQLNIIDDGGHRGGSTVLPRYLREQFLDGVVVFSNSAQRDAALRTDLERFGIPAIFFNAAGEYNCVTLDDREGGAVATRHLIGLGHRRIAFLGSESDHYSMSERVRGYQEMMEAAGLETITYLLESCPPEDQEFHEKRLAFSQRAARRFVDEVMRQANPTGIVCYDDRIALLIIKTLTEAGLSVPRDVSVVGFNDMPFMDLLLVSLTTMGFNRYHMGQVAGQMLLELIENPTVPLPSPIIKPDLVVRQSTSPRLAPGL